MDDDIEAAIKTAQHLRTKYRKGLLNPLSSLPESKEKLRSALKERIKILAVVYISLASFIDDDDLYYLERNPMSKRTKTIYLKALKDIKAAQQEMRRFKILS